MAQEEQKKLYQKPAFWVTIGVLLALVMLGTTFFSSQSEWREQKAVLVPAAPKPALLLKGRLCPRGREPG